MSKMTSTANSLPARCRTRRRTDIPRAIRARQPAADPNEAASPRSPAKQAGPQTQPQPPLRGEEHTREGFGLGPEAQGDGVVAHGAGYAGGAGGAGQFHPALRAVVA